MVFEGESAIPDDAVVEAGLEFLADAAGGTRSEVGATFERGLKTILFTDLESSTALTTRVGDEAAQEVIRGHNATVPSALDEDGGRKVKHTGDGIMASFPSAVNAVQAALQIQRDLTGGGVRERLRWPRDGTLYRTLKGAESLGYVRTRCGYERMSLELVTRRARFVPRSLRFDMR
jgi:class 3 adenylate cyclase